MRKKFIKASLSFLTVVFLLPCLLIAENRYIRADATGAGNGTSWADAWTTFSSVNWVRGITYFVAGGTYNEDIKITTPESGTDWIIIKKANAADNGTDAGWNSSYTTAQVLINGRIEIYYGYLEIDGITGSLTSGHGIKIHTSKSYTGIDAVIVLANTTASPRRFKHLDIEGPGYDYGSTGGDGLYWNSRVPESKGLHISNCWIHEIPRNGVTLGIMSGTSYEDYGLLFENNVLERTGGVGMRYPKIHGQAMQFYMQPLTYSIFRNNIFHNISGQAYISILEGVVTDHIRIYNNIFYNNNGVCNVYGRADSGSNTSITQLYRMMTGYENLTGKVLTNITKGSTGVITSVSNGVGTPIIISGGMSGGVVNEAGDEFSFPTTCRSAYGMATSIYSSAGNQFTYVEIYNNTFYNNYKPAITIVTPSDKTGTIARNNLWVNGLFTDTRVFWPLMTNTGYYNNIYGPYSPVNTEASDPFVNSAEYDFHLKSTANAVNSGADLSFVFDYDMDFIPRPQGIAWDIGAYEYESGVAVDELDVPNEYVLLLQNQPNPFNRSTVIGWYLASGTGHQVKNNHVVLKIFDFMGKEVETLVDANMTPGEHKVNFDASRLQAGVYFYQLNVNGVVETKKMLIIKL